MEFRKVDVHEVEKGVGLVRTRKHVEKDEGPLQGSNDTNHLVNSYVLVHTQISWWPLHGRLSLRVNVDYLVLTRPISEKRSYWTT